MHRYRYTIGTIDIVQCNDGRLLNTSGVGGRTSPNSHVFFRKLRFERLLSSKPLG